MTELTRRQKEVCDLIMQGRTNKEIGRALSISSRTVEDHRTDIYKKNAGYEQHGSGPSGFVKAYRRT